MLLLLLLRSQVAFSRMNAQPISGRYREKEREKKDPGKTEREKESSENEGWWQKLVSFPAEIKRRILCWAAASLLYLVNQVCKYIHTHAHSLAIQCSHVSSSNTYSFPKKASCVRTCVVWGNVWPLVVGCQLVWSDESLLPSQLYLSISFSRFLPSFLPFYLGARIDLSTWRSWENNTMRESAEYCPITRTTLRDKRHSVPWFCCLSIVASQ